MRRINAISAAKLMRALIDGPSTIHELTDACGLHLLTVRKYVLALRDEGVCCVAAWEQDNRGVVCVHAYGLGDTDVPRPKPMVSNARRMRAYRVRNAQVKVLHSLAGTL